MTSTPIIFLISIFAVPYAVLFGVLYLWGWNINRRNERPPITEKLLRPPGESLRRRLAEMDLDLLQAVLIVIVQPLWFLLIVIILAKAHLGLNPLQVLIIGGIAAVIGFTWATARLLRIVDQVRKYNLGFHGERAVGEEINRLMRDGCYVFHDLPMEPYGNIDHVIVAPSGVYAVETKTRRKRKAPPGKKDHVVFYDGDTLEYPHCRDSHGLQQSKQQADRLRVFLTKAVGETVNVKPILTLPGWFITNRVKPEIPVLAPKGIRSAVLNGSSQTLSAQQMQRIVHQIEQKCRDVEL